MTSGKIPKLILLVFVLALFSVGSVSISSAQNGVNAEITWSPETPTVGETVEFNASASNSEYGDIVSYRLDIDGDGSYEYIQDTPLFEHIYEEPGEYNVVLRVYNETEYSDTTEELINIENEDIDGDGILNENDNCPGTPNEPQRDQDEDGTGDECDSDIDGDGVQNFEDECPREPGEPGSMGCPVEQIGPAVSLSMNPSSSIGVYTSVSVNATATAPTGLQQITIYLDNKSVGQCTSSPCIVNIGTLSQGSHRINASVTNTSGGTNTSNVISFTVKGASVSLSFLQSQPFRENQSIDIAMAATNAPSQSSLKLLIDRVPRKTCNNQCTRTVKLRNSGTLTAKVQLLDSNGNVIANATKPLSVLHPNSPPNINKDIVPPDISTWTWRTGPTTDYHSETIKVNASDPSGLAYVYVKHHEGNTKIDYCGEEAGRFGLRSKTCNATNVSLFDGFNLEPGPNHFTAVAVDNEGNRGQASTDIFYLTRNRIPINISLSHNPPRPSKGSQIEFTAKASTQLDYPAIKSLNIRLFGLVSFPKIVECKPSGVKKSITCKGNYTPPRNLDKLIYLAEAKIPNGSRTSSGKTVILAKPGPDSDNDGLRDHTEKSMCTDPNDPDTDGDSLKDGWEVTGILYNDGHSVDLPGMGAHPCRKDVFIEMDWRKGYDFSGRALQMFKNAMKDGGITPHIDQGKYGGGNELNNPNGRGPPYFSNGYEFVRLKEENFDPHRQGIFHWAASVSGGNGGAYMFNNDVKIQTGRYSSDKTDAYLLFHEIGHSIGLGHGGRSGNRYQVYAKDRVGYTGSWDSFPNYKTNYLSSMNYGYSNAIYWDKSAESFAWTLDFSRAKLPTLDESSLDERPSSKFMKALKNYPVPKRAQNDWVAAIKYTCKGDDGAVQRIATPSMIIRDKNVSTGNKNWIKKQQSGMDWDCDGNIEKSVSQNLDGGRGNKGWFTNTSNWRGGQKLVGRSDWDKLTQLSSCPGKQKSTWKISGAKQNKGPTPSNSWMNRGHNPPCINNRSSHLPSNPVVHKHELPYDDLPNNTEACDGIDNNGNGEIDEVCSDRDNDGIVDLMDNCPDIQNEKQVDTDRDYIGDKCGKYLDGPGDLSADVTSDGDVELSWSNVSGARGYTLYRRGDNGTVYLGEGYPSINETTYIDTNASGEVTYWVRPVNQASGLENNRSYVTATIGGTGNDGLQSNLHIIAGAVVLLLILILGYIKQRKT